MRVIHSALGLGALLCASTLAAQTAQPLGWATAAELGLNAARGNSSYTTLSSGLRLTHLNKRAFEFESASGLVYGESDGTVIARRMFTSLKGDLHPDATWSPFVFSSIERDRIRRIDLLSYSGVGAKYTYFRNPRGAASISLAAVEAYKSITASTDPVTPGTEPKKSTTRFSLRPKVAQKFPSGFSFEQTSYWQPVISDMGDYTVEASTRLGYVVSKSQSIFLQHTYRADTRPAVGVKREDQLLVAGIKIAF